MAYRRIHCIVSMCKYIISLLAKLIVLNSGRWLCIATRERLSLPTRALEPYSARF